MIRLQRTQTGFEQMAAGRKNTEKQRARRIKRISDAVKNTKTKPERSCVG